MDVVIVLLLGGARSGKSAMAERLASALAGDRPVTVLATAVVPEGDADMAARVAAHRARRPPSWPTVETGPGLVGSLRSAGGTVLVDSLGSWVAGRPEMAADGEGLCGALAARAGDTVVVSEEVGLGVHPSSAAGRRFRDVLGELNQAVAAVADEVVFAAAGRALRLVPVDSVVGAVLGAGDDGR
ncbi:MAG TPA: bifunctional adenosylcobinamide kinase/adenosylcobinamide-phosphate guanylyltransferase [Acidimicrobiales bacterium]|nr:bifunctional adenosylcobinamide kinase/adenosylcobinamide-phosphate guanylyltransferase [Acidimicrobiales bacterium]